MIIDQLFTRRIFEVAPVAPAAPVPAAANNAWNKVKPPMQSPEQLAYNRLRAQYDSYQTMTSDPSGKTVVSRDPAHAAKLATVPAELARMAAALKAKGIDAEAQYNALSGPKAAPVDANQAYDDVEEGRKKKKKKTSRSLGRYFFPGFGYYGSEESGEGGGDGGGGESAKPGMAEGEVTKNATGLRHRATDKYGAGDDEPHHYTGGRSGFSEPGKYARDLEHVNKQLVKDLDASMGISWKNRGPKGLEVDEQGMSKEHKKKDVKEGLEQFGDEYLRKAADPNRFGRFLISVEQAQAELDARAQGKQQVSPPAPPPAKSQGFSKEYLQGVVNGTHPRPLITKEKAQELLNQMNENINPLMLKLKRAMVQEGRVKELADDLKTMPDADFMKKYGKAKAAIRRDMKRVDEAGPAMPAAPAAPAAPAEPDEPDEPDEAPQNAALPNKFNAPYIPSGLKFDATVDPNAPARPQNFSRTYDPATKKWTTTAPIQPALPDPAAWRKAPGPGYQTNAIRDRSRVNGVWRNNPQAANPMSQDPAQRIAGYQEMEKRIAADNAAARAGVDNSDPEAYEFDHWLDNGMGYATPVLKSGAVQGLFKKPLSKVPPGAKILPQHDTYQQQGEYAYPVDATGGMQQAFKVRIDQVPKGAKIVQAPQQGGALFKNLPGAAPATPPAASAKPSTPAAQPAGAPVNELSTNQLARYKTAAARDAKRADQAGDFKRGDRRLSGMVQATKKQFDNDAKKVDESRAARRALMARIVNSR